MGIDKAGEQHLPRSVDNFTPLIRFNGGLHLSSRADRDDHPFPGGERSPFDQAEIFPPGGGNGPPLPPTRHGDESVDLLEEKIGFDPRAHSFLLSIMGTFIPLSRATWIARS